MKAFPFIEWTMALLRGTYTAAKPMTAEFRTNIRFLFAIFVFVSGSNPRRYVSDKNPSLNYEFHESIIQLFTSHFISQRKYHQSMFVQSEIRLLLAIFPRLIYFSTRTMNLESDFKLRAVKLSREAVYSGSSRDFFEASCRCYLRQGLQHDY